MMFRECSDPRANGSVPVKELSFNSRISIFPHPLIEEGIVPLKSLWFAAKYFSDSNPFVGRSPDRLFPCNNLKDAEVDG